MYSDYDTARSENEAQIELMIIYILDDEGGYVDHYADRGRETNYGITRATWNAYCKSERDDLLPASVKDISRGEAEEYYQYRFKRSGVWRLNPEIYHAVFDFQVNAGRHAINALQELVISKKSTLAMTVDVDGVLGEKTANAVDLIYNYAGSRKFIFDYACKRFTYYTSLVERNPSQEVFLLGWLNRTFRTIGKYNRFTRIKS